MNKLLTILFLLFISCSVVSAENFTYKVYNPNLNKSYTAELGSLGYGIPDEYVLAFFINKEPYCIIDMYNYINNDGYLDINKKNGLVEGKCFPVDIWVDYKNGKIKNPTKFSWRELSTNTFDLEVHSIIKERSLKDMKLVIMED